MSRSTNRYAPPDPLRRVPPFARVTAQSWQTALLFRDGRCIGTVSGGSRRVTTTRTAVRLVDLRPWVLVVPTQEVPTAEGVSVKLSLTAQVRVADALQYVTGSQDPTSALYLALQVAIRQVVAGLPVDELVAARAEVASSISDAVIVDPALGLAVDALDVRDVILPGELKRARAQVLVARAEGEAALERARGETAALRNLANAARLAADSPALLDLRLLQQLGSTTGNTVVLGGWPAIGRGASSLGEPAGTDGG